MKGRIRRALAWPLGIVFDMGDPNRQVQMAIVRGSAIARTASCNNF